MFSSKICIQWIFEATYPLNTNHLLLLLLFEIIVSLSNLRTNYNYYILHVQNITCLLSSRWNHYAIFNRYKTINCICFTCKIQFCLLKCYLFTKQTVFLFFSFSFLNVFFKKNTSIALFRKFVIFVCFENLKIKKH